MNNKTFVLFDTYLLNVGTIAYIEIIGQTVVIETLGISSNKKYTYTYTLDDTYVSIHNQISYMLKSGYASFYTIGSTKDEHSLFIEPSRLEIAELDRENKKVKLETCDVKYEFNYDHVTDYRKTIDHELVTTLFDDAFLAITHIEGSNVL